MILVLLSIPQLKLLLEINFHRLYVDKPAATYLFNIFQPFMF